ncbi:hypothetical protein Clacol_001128 [Clathrus columnatus]|uniref:Cytochrome P450 n=1 Tax=Clathrus columnatus TaxID=1419009 RepID=A0AAV4ZXQ7_9AGAM|nr:hypothetical protein Clacol_001128 [Clathrus columnatus]
MDKANVALISLVICSSFILYKTLIKKPQPAPFPPGPKGLPLIANLADMPQARSWETYTEWAEIYGPIVHINVLGNHIVILNDPKYAAEMLDSKGRLYSGRPSFVMSGQMVGWDESPALMPLSDTWVEYRKLMANFLGTRSKVENFEYIIHEEVKELLTRFMSIPNEYRDHFENYTGSVVLMLTYGYKPVEANDPLVRIVNDAVQGWSEMTINGAYAVDSFPMLRFVPSWFPGAGWKVKAIKYRQGLTEMLERPYEWTRQQMALGNARPCFVTDVLEGKKLTPQEEKVIQWTAAGMYSGGAHTTAAGLCFFLLAVVRHTAELQRAQAEIDAFIGNDRLPTLADRPHLPYFDALCMEVHRVYPIGGVGFPHVALDDDVHDGYFIPKGSILFSNNWLFNHNEKVYPNPNEFFPERFLETVNQKKQKNPGDYLFGFGRRICPGLHLSDAVQWLASAALITAFDIRPVVKDGKPIIPPANVQVGSISFPEPFEYVMTPRSKFSKALLQKS